MAFRESSVVIIETGRRTIRAGLGLGELLHVPSVELPARVGLRRGTGTPEVNGANNASNEEAMATDLPSNAQKKLRVSDYLVGKTLDDALDAGEDLEVSWPFERGDVSDWIQAEAIWKHALFSRLELRRKQNESPVLLTFLPCFSRQTIMHITQIFFERFNVAGFSIAERPLVQMYAANALSGCMVEIGHDKTDVMPIFDCALHHAAGITIPLGIRDCERHAARCLRSNQSIIQALSPASSPLEPEKLEEELQALARQIWQDGLVKVPVDGETALEPEEEGLTNIAAVLVAGKEKAIIEGSQKKKVGQSRAAQSAAEREREKEIAALDLVQVQFKQYPLMTIGKERHRFCEPLFDPSLLDTLASLKDPVSEDIHRNVSQFRGMSIQDAVYHSIKCVDELGRRLYMWDGVFMTGELGNIKDLSTALQSRLHPFATQQPNNETQPRSVRVLKVPEYFAEFKDTGARLAAFLGAGIVAKLVYGDAAGKNFVSKGDYSSRGPQSILESCPTVL